MFHFPAENSRHFKTFEDTDLANSVFALENIYPIFFLLIKPEKNYFCK